MNFMIFLLSWLKVLYHPVEFLIVVCVSAVYAGDWLSSLVPFVIKYVVVDDGRNY